MQFSSVSDFTSKPSDAIEFAVQNSPDICIEEVISPELMRQIFNQLGCDQQALQAAPIVCGRWRDILNDAPLNFQVYCLYKQIITACPPQNSEPKIYKTNMLKAIGERRRPSYLCHFALLNGAWYFVAERAPIPKIPDAKKDFYLTVNRTSIEMVSKDHIKFRIFYCYGYQLSWCGEPSSFTSVQKKALDMALKYLAENNETEIKAYKDSKTGKNYTELFSSNKDRKG